MTRLVVDGKSIEGVEGQSVLAVCLQNGIYIPNLCYIKEMKDPPASCRLCFVEIEGEARPMASCKVEAREGMVVRTDTPWVRRLQRTALRLLLSAHDADCKNCPSNKKCDLQKMVRLLGVRLRPRRVPHLDRETAPRAEHPLLDIVDARCVLCGRCVSTCSERTGHPLLTFAHRGFNTVVTAMDDGRSDGLPCQECRACVDVCPVSAIRLKESPSCDQPHSA